MKNIFFLLLVFPALFSCNKKESSSEPLLACPLLYEFEKLVVNFELTGGLPTEPAVYVNDKLVLECSEGMSEVCIHGMTLQNKKLTYRMQSREQVLQDTRIDLYDNATLRLSRTNETFFRSRTRPKDPCGSGYVSEVTIKE